ncbi:hypothetical protein N288_20925 [Bacillus infantis NRRL B-14911]|uniref:Uncharacterized protein n=1 Tax=Bacillus infantis NRRL B-14911 TaxID=1367477 RepID=U5LH76_9BACI|nr:hypothetical protein N288_20925 [Bacillus infantis NRRL B-14911]
MGCRAASIFSEKGCSHCRLVSLMHKMKHILLQRG